MKQVEAKTNVAVLKVPEPTPKEKALVVNTASLTQQVNRCVINNDDDAEKATSLASMVAEAYNKAEAERKELVTPLNNVVKMINDRYKKNLTDALYQAKTALRDKIANYLEAKHVQLEREAAALAKKQQKAEEEGRTRAAANLAVKRGMVQAASESGSKVRGIVGGSATLRKVWRWRVEDENAVPRAYLTVNANAILEHIDLCEEKGKGAPEPIPGIIFLQDSILRIR
jgi:ABC-type transporter Mla subunit MlaD